MDHPAPQSAESSGFGVTIVDRYLAGPMFLITMIWLGAAGLAIHLLADETGRFDLLAHVCRNVLLALMPCFVAEAIAHFVYGSPRLGQNVAACLFPPLRLGARDHVDGTRIWLPSLGWRKANRELAEELELRLGYPMIGIAFLILPLLGIEHVYAEAIEKNARLGLAVQMAGGFIWLCFAAEFIVMISLVTKRLKFIKDHWLDLAIICLPLIAFLRAMRIMRVARLTRTARVFRLRGLAMRAWRTVLLLEIVDRLMHRNPQKRLAQLREQLAEKEIELSEIRLEITRLESVVIASTVSIEPIPDSTTSTRELK